MRKTVFHRGLTGAHLRAILMSEDESWSASVPEFDLASLLQSEAIRTWIRIMVWVWAFSIVWIAALLLRGGFTDLSEVVGARWSTRRERFDAAARMPFRLVTLLIAAVFGATSFAVPLWIQGAIVITLWTEFVAA